MAICDAVSIKECIKQTYKSKVKGTTFFAYGADVQHLKCSDEELINWYRKFGIKKMSII